MKRINGIYFDSNPYEREHGKLPRGRGSWAFADINERNDPSRAQFFSGPFAEARDRAAREMDPPSGILAVLP